MVTVKMESLSIAAEILADVKKSLYVKMKKNKAAGITVRLDLNFGYIATA
jgi:hypothetical protein